MFNHILYQFELFQQMNRFDQEEETGLNNELKYLKYIRDVRDNNPEMFKKVKELPKKIKIKEYVV